MVIRHRGYLFRSYMLVGHWWPQVVVLCNCHHWIACCQKCAWVSECIIQDPVFSVSLPNIVRRLDWNKENDAGGNLPPTFNVICKRTWSKVTLQHSTVGGEEEDAGEGEDGGGEGEGGARPQWPLRGRGAWSCHQLVGGKLGVHIWPWLELKWGRTEFWGKNVKLDSSRTCQVHEYDADLVIEAPLSNTSLKQSAQRSPKLLPTYGVKETRKQGNKTRRIKQVVYIHCSTSAFDYKYHISWQLVSIKRDTSDWQFTVNSH